MHVHAQIMCGFLQQICIKSYYMQHPKEVSIGDPYFVPAFSGTKQRLVQKQDTFQYVSLLGTLQNVLKTDILDFILQPNHREDELLEDSVMESDINLILFSQ